MAFSDYLKTRSTLLEETTKAIEATNPVGFAEDPDDWYPKTDKGGNAVAIVRFLPPLENEGAAFVKWFSHQFQNPTTQKWYIENCLSTFEQPDPVAEYNKKLWNSTKDEDHPNRKQASAQKRNLNYRSNIYIISDSANPENNGTIKKFKYGKTIFDLIRHSMNPPKIDGLAESEQETPMNPFDLVEGANLRIQISTEMKGQKKQRSYKNTKFTDRKPLGSMDMMEKIYNEIQNDPARWSLKKYTNKEQFKSYDDLKARLDLTLGFDTATGEPLASAQPKASSKPESYERATPKQTGATTAKSQKGDSEGDSDDSYFDSLMGD